MSSGAVGRGRRTRGRAIGVVVGLLALAGGTTRADEAGDCAARLGEPAARVVRADGASIAWRPRPAPVPLNAPFSIDWVACTPGAAAATAVRVDAWMPAHRHGMNYRPTVTGAPGGPMRADGLILHMPGRWQLVFELQLDGRLLRVVDELVLR